jgi:hypothetical protein
MVRIGITTTSKRGISMTAKQSTRRKAAPSPAFELPSESVLDSAMSRIHEAKSIIAMAGNSVTNEDFSTEDARSRISLALSGAERLLDLAHDAVDITHGALHRIAVNGCLQEGSAASGAEGSEAATSADKSAPLGLASSLLAVCVSAYHHGDEPANASPADVAGAIRASREHLESALKAEFESQTGDIFVALDLLVLAEAYLVSGSTLRSPSPGLSPIRGALRITLGLIEGELASVEGEPTAPGKGDSSASGEVPQAA